MLDTRMDDATLVGRLRKGDSGAYEQLVRIHADRVHGVAARVLGNGTDAQDASQEVFLAAWKGIHGFDGRSALSTWLHRIAVNASLAILRSKSRGREVPVTDIDNGRSDNAVSNDFFAEVEDSRPDPVEQADIARLVWRAVEELPEEYRLVLVLRDVEEMPSKEVAAALGLSDATIRQRLHRARQVIAERLRPELCVGRHLTCGGRLDLLFDWIDHELTSDLRTPVAKHLGSCERCQDLVGKYRQTITAPRDLWRRVAPATDLERLIRAIPVGIGDAC